MRPVELHGHRYLLESFVDVTEQKRSEKALEQRTSYLNTLIETNPLGTVVLDKEERVEMSNSAFEQTFLFSRNELLGKRLNELIVPEGLAEESDRFTRECLERRGVQVVSRRRRKDNTLVDVEIYGVPLVIGGEPRGILAFTRMLPAASRSRPNCAPAKSDFALPSRTLLMACA